MLNTLPLLVVIANMQVVQPVIIKTPDLELEFTARTPNQMGSFYEARGFPKSMLNILKKHCYITAGLTNMSDQKIWLDLSRWEFSSAGKPLKREHRDYWKKRWQDMGIPLNKQSTFRWTLIPESLDYLPGEHEGGNLVLPFTNQPITLKATFSTGENKQGKEIIITTDQLFCAEDEQ
ncbi:MAG: hypothetical protein GQ572_03490 [Gammaproteobacteria bacterium]|jgi:hypothetical protein|nr:hypothetical protein [Gammaproteobacteria bacterium]